MIPTLTTKDKIDILEAAKQDFVKENYGAVYLRSGICHPIIERITFHPKNRDSTKKNTPLYSVLDLLQQFDFEILQSATGARIHGVYWWTTNVKDGGYNKRVDAFDVLINQYKEQYANQERQLS